MDKVVLKSKLPEDLVNLIMDFKPRDRDMKSPTATMIKTFCGYFEGEEHPFFWIVQKRWYPYMWIASAHMFQLGQYTERYWDMNAFLNDPFADTHWWDRKIEQDELDFNDPDKHCDCCAELWQDCQCICSNCGNEYNLCRYECYNGS